MELKLELDNQSKMPHIKKLARLGSLNNNATKEQVIPNWFPGHMYAGMQAMIGKLNTVDCIVEVHDARIPFTGRNTEFRQHLGRIKPRVLLLNKQDLADLSRWTEIEKRLHNEGDEHVILSDLTGSEFSFNQRGYTQLLQKVMDLINSSNRFNRQNQKAFKIMITGIPNVGKSTLINRLRHLYMGSKGEATRVGPEAGVTKHVENIIKICARPRIYTLDTPGVLEPSKTKDLDASMQLALCSNINDAILKPIQLAQYLLDYLNKKDNTCFRLFYGLDKPIESVMEFSQFYNNKMNEDWKERVDLDLVKNDVPPPKIVDIDTVCWRMVKDFRKGNLGKIMFD